MVLFWIQSQKHYSFHEDRVMSVKICVSDKFILGLKIKGLIRSQVVLSVLTEEVQRGPEPRQYINKEGSIVRGLEK